MSPRRGVVVGDERYWSRTTTENGTEFFLVEAATGARTAAFDQAKVSGGALGSRPFQLHGVSPAVQPVRIQHRPHINLVQRRRQPVDVRHRGRTLRGQRASCGAAHRALARRQARGVHPRLEPVGPRCRERQETQLTRDGVKDFGYATDNAGWTRSDARSALVARLEEDRDVPAGQRGAGEMYLVDTRIGHPKLQAWKYPLPGDEITMIQRVVIDVDRGKVVRLQMPADQHRSSLCDDLACRGEWGDVQWAADGSTVAFVSSGRAITTRAAARRRCGDRGPSGRCWRKRPKRFSSRATAR